MWMEVVKILLHSLLHWCAKEVFAAYFDLGCFCPGPAFAVFISALFPPFFSALLAPPSWVFHVYKAQCGGTGGLPMVLATRTG